MIRRVYANQHDIITLDSDMFGSRKRISTGKKSDKRLITWYEKNFDESFKSLYDEKFKPQKEDFNDLTLRYYGTMVLDLTSENRREYVQATAVKMFNRVCNFQMSDNKLFGDMMLTDIKSIHIMKWQKECGYSYQTLSNYRSYLNLVLQTAMNDDIIRKNPIISVKLPPKVLVRKMRFFSESEIKTLINTAKGQLKNYIQLCCFSGLRGSELVALRWDDIDFEKGSIRVDSGIVSGHEDETKSTKTRYVPMFKQAKEALIRQRKKSGLREFVFINPYGDNYHGSATMNIAFRKMMKKNDLGDGTIHDLRRSFNTLLKQYGYPKDWILDVIGHVSESVNRDHYTGHLNVDMSKIGNIIL